MPHTLSRLVTPFLQALMRLVRCIFRRGRVADAEDGTLTPNEAFTVKDAVLNAAVPTFTPDLAGVPALALASMSVGSEIVSKVPKSVTPMAAPRVIPSIVITPPPDEKDLKLTKERAHKHINVLQSTSANTVKRVHGRTPPKHAKDGKENIGLHPNAPRRPQPRPAPVSLYAPPPRARAQAHVAAVPASTPTQLALAPVESAAAHPASSAWELAKTAQLEQNRKWSAGVQARQHRRSLPTPPAAPMVNTPLARSASLPLARSTSAPRPLPRCAPIQVASRAPPPVRLPLAERLQRACKPPAVEAVPVARLWGDVSTSFVLGFEDADYDDEEDQQQTQHKDTRKPATIPLASSSSGSITGILNALEADILHSPAWLGRRRFLEVEVC